MHDEYMQKAMQGQPLGKQYVGSPFGHSKTRVDDLATTLAKALRDVIDMRGNQIARDEDAVKRHDLIVTKIIEIQGLLAV